MLDYITRRRQQLNGTTYSKENEDNSKQEREGKASKLDEEQNTKTVWRNDRNNGQKKKRLSAS